MSTPGTVLVVAVPAAVVGAASFGLASAVQQRATQQVPQIRALHPRLLWELVRKPIWVASVVTVIGGLSLQMVALAFGPLLLVQPLLVTSVLFGGVFAAWMAGRRMDRIVALGALGCVVGLAGFLIVAMPSGSGQPHIDQRDAPLAAVFAAIVVACLLAAAHLPREVRALALALATGVLYGVTAALLKVVASQLREGGVAAPFQHWVLYAICVLGPAGFLLSQNAFQAGRLISPALAVITTVDPLVGIAVGVSWFGEHMALTPLALAGETVAAVVLIGGVLLLTRRSEQLRDEVDRRSAAEGSRGRTWG